MNNFLFKKQYKNVCRGFTLIELMVATALFIVVMLMAMGSLTVSNATNKRSQQLSSAMENVNFAVESMARSIRVGSNYICKLDPDTLNISDFSNITLPSPANCGFSSIGGYLIAFKPSTTMNISGSTLVAYRLKDNGTYHSLQRVDAGNTNGTDITSSNVNIDVLKFFVLGADLNDHIQPSVYIIMKGTVTVEGDSSSFAIQTIASQRSTE